MFLNIDADGEEASFSGGSHILGFLTTAYQSENLIDEPERAIAVALKVVIACVQQRGEQTAHFAVAGAVDDEGVRRVVSGNFGDEAVIIGLKPPSTNGRRFSPISITGHFPI